MVLHSMKIYKTTSNQDYLSEAPLFHSMVKSVYIVYIISSYRHLLRAILISLPATPHSPPIVHLNKQLYNKLMSMQVIGTLVEHAVDMC